MIKLLAWNIRQGGGSRVLKIIEKVNKSKADIISFSEFRNNHHGIRLRNKFMELGYRFQFVSASTPQENSVCIFSKFPAHSILYSASDYEYFGNVITVEFDAFRFTGVYLPHKKKHKLFNILFNEANAEVPAVIMGDYNTGKNYIDQKGDSFWYTTEMKKLEKLGMIDAFRKMHEDSMEYSWVSHQGNGYRYDQCYVDESLQSIIRDCYYEHSWREAGISDHSPLFLELG